MGLLSWLIWGRGEGIKQLARRLAVEPRLLRKFRPTYREFAIRKRSGDSRRILAPDDELKKLQRRILRRLLARLHAHPAAHGFERKRSIVSNAAAHQRQEVLIRLDVIDFFPATQARRVKAYFRRIGWNRPAAKILSRLCTHEGGLPQGAPTSPRLSNLVNYRIDARLAGMAAAFGGVYTRYADDIAISFSKEDDAWVARSGTPQPPRLTNHPAKVRYLLAFVQRVLREEGYQLHVRKKFSVRRRHHRQLVTGLVVNERVNLPRETRRRLRAIEHRQRLAGASAFDYREPTGYRRRKQPTLTAEQLAGWRAFQAMIACQASAQEP